MFSKYFSRNKFFSMAVLGHYGPLLVGYETYPIYLLSYRLSDIFIKYSEQTKLRPEFTCLELLLLK